MKRYLAPVFPLFLCIMAWSSYGYAQNPIHRCVTDEAVEQRDAKNPGYKAKTRAMFDYAKKYAQATRSANKTNADSLVVDTIYRIPVVVHVIYNTEEENLDDSLIYSQIEVLNRDFGHRNADSVNTREIFSHLWGDAKIEFFLAETDPDGNSTTGITRTETAKTSMGSLVNIAQMDDNVKRTANGGEDAWDPAHYLNIWVADISDPLFGDGLLGYAYPPDQAPNWPANSAASAPELDGVVIHYKVFGRNNPLAVDLLADDKEGRTPVHEVGHYLGLRHIWGDGGGPFGGIDCTKDDGIEDTPNAGNSSQEAGCDTTKNTCTDDFNDLPDMWENYMDYAKEQCQNMFTQQQIGIMRSILASRGRENLAVVVLDTVSGKDTSTTVRAIEKLVRACRVYPSPAQNELRVDLQLTAQTTCWIELRSMQGAVVYRREVLADQQTQTVVPVQHLSNGLYILRVETPFGVINRKAVVMK